MGYKNVLDAADRIRVWSLSWLFMQQNFNAIGLRARGSGIKTNMIDSCSAVSHNHCSQWCLLSSLWSRVCIPLSRAAQFAAVQSCLTNEVKMQQQHSVVCRIKFILSFATLFFFSCNSYHLLPWLLWVPLASLFGSLAWQNEAITGNLVQRLEWQQYLLSVFLHSSQSCPLLCPLTAAPLAVSGLRWAMPLICRAGPLHNGCFLLVDSFPRRDFVLQTLEKN